MLVSFPGLSAIKNWRWERPGNETKCRGARAHTGAGVAVRVWAAKCMHYITLRQRANSSAGARLIIICGYKFPSGLQKITRLQSSMMASHTVLLINGERRKVVEIPAGVADRDYDYLRGVFARTFSAKDEDNIHLQRYNRDWEEWVDVDEDFVAVDRERIKVVESLDLHAAKSQDEVISIMSYVVAQ